MKYIETSFSKLSRLDYISDKVRQILGTCSSSIATSVPASIWCKNPGWKVICVDSKAVLLLVDRKQCHGSQVPAEVAKSQENDNCNGFEKFPDLIRYTVM